MTGHRPRIGQFIDTTGWGGAEAVVLSCCESLSDAGFDPVLLHFGHDTLVAHCDRLGLDHLLLPASRAYKKTLTLPLFAWQFSRFLRHARIDLVHAHLFGPVTATGPGAWLARIPAIGTLHDVYMYEEKPRRGHLLCLAHRLGTRLVTVSQHMRGVYAHLGCLKENDIVLIPNGIATPPPDPDTQALRQELGVAPEDALAVCVARFVPLKRHDLLVDAMDKLRNAALRLLLLGDGPLMAPLQDEVRARGLEDRIIFKGHRDDVPRWLRAADIFVLSSDTEGLSRSILEAMGCGLPVVATDVGGNHELVDPGENGILVPPGSVERLTLALKELAADTAQRAAMGRRALEKIREQFSIQSMIDSYVRQYRALLQRRGDNRTGNDQ